MRATNVLQILFFLGLISFLGCGKKDLEAPDYLSWVHQPENGMLKTRKVDKIQVEVLYKPADYILLKESQHSPTDDAAWAKRMEEFKGMHYFECRFSVLPKRKDTNIVNFTASDQDQLAQRQYYFSYLLKNDISLENGEEEVGCKLYHFERSYDLATHRTALLAFEKKDLGDDENDLTLVIDSPFLGTGPMKFKFKKENLTKIPNLKR